MTKRYTDMANPVADALGAFKRGEVTWEATLETLRGDVGKSTYPEGKYEDLDDPRNHLRMAENGDYDPYEAVRMEPGLTPAQRSAADAAVATGIRARLAANGITPVD